MPELPEPGTEDPCPHMGLRDAVDQAGAPYERKAELAHRWAERLAEESGIEAWPVNHIPVRIPASAQRHIVGTWPDGQPMEVVTYWVTPEVED